MDVAFEFWFVDDGSTDGTLEALKRLRERDPRVKYISFSRNFGKEAAMLAGMKYSSGDYIGILDADLQHSPELIVEMLEALESSIGEVARARVIAPAEAVVATHAAARDAVDALL